jgi:hypothetical protein
MLCAHHAQLFGDLSFYRTRKSLDNGMFFVLNHNPRVTSSLWLPTRHKYHQGELDILIPVT